MKDLNALHILKVGDFNFEKFKRTCNNMHEVIDITDNNEKRLFINAVYTNGAECDPLVLGSGCAYAYYVREGVVYGVRKGDDRIIFCEIYTVQDFIIQEYDEPFAVLDFKEHK